MSFLVLFAANHLAIFKVTNLVSWSLSFYASTVLMTYMLYDVRRFFLAQDFSRVFWVCISYMLLWQNTWQKQPRKGRPVSEKQEVCGSHTELESRRRGMPVLSCPPLVIGTPASKTELPTFRAFFPSQSNFCVNTFTDTLTGVSLRCLKI